MYDFVRLAEASRLVVALMHIGQWELLGTPPSKETTQECL